MSSLYAFILAAANISVPNRDHSVLAESLSRVLDESPALFSNDVDKKKSASILIAIGKRESNLEIEATGDHGTSFCTYQIHKSIGGSDELNKDPYKCAQKAYSFLRYSIKSCPEYPIAIYASGPSACSNDRAKRISTDRMNLANWILRETGKKLAQ